MLIAQFYLWLSLAQLWVVPGSRVGHQGLCTKTTHRELPGEGIFSWAASRAVRFDFDGDTRHLREHHHLASFAHDESDEVPGTAAGLLSSRPESPPGASPDSQRCCRVICKRSRRPRPAKLTCLPYRSYGGGFHSQISRPPALQFAMVATPTCSSILGWCGAARFSNTCYHRITTRNVRHYGLTLFEQNAVIQFDPPEYALVPVATSAPNHRRDFLTLEQGGGGYFVERHNFPLSAPLQSDCDGHWLVKTDSTAGVHARIPGGTARIHRQTSSMATVVLLVSMPSRSPAHPPSPHVVLQQRHTRDGTRRCAQRWCFAHVSTAVRATHHGQARCRSRRNSSGLRRAYPIDDCEIAALKADSTSGLPICATGLQVVSAKAMRTALSGCSIC